MKHYSLTCVWTNKEKKYKSIELWSDQSKNDLCSHIIEYLDLLCIGGIPYKPTLKQVRESFLQFGFTDKESIKHEFDRLNKGWKAWKTFEKKMKNVEEDNLLSNSFTIDVDEYTSIAVDCFEYF